MAGTVTVHAGGTPCCSCKKTGKAQDVTQAVPTVARYSIAGFNGCDVVRISVASIATRQCHSCTCWDCSTGTAHSATGKGQHLHLFRLGNILQLSACHAERMRRVFRYDGLLGLADWPIRREFVESQDIYLKRSRKRHELERCAHQHARLPAWTPDHTSLSGAAAASTSKHAQKYDAWARGGCP